MQRWTISTRGKRGKKYKFNVYSIGTELENIPEVSGIYVLAKDSLKDPDSVDLIYIGEAENVYDRIQTHDKWECFDENEAEYVGVHPIQGEKARFDAETDLRQVYDTPCNLQ